MIDIKDQEQHDVPSSLFRKNFIRRSNVRCVIKWLSLSYLQVMIRFVQESQEIVNSVRTVGHKSNIINMWSPVEQGQNLVLFVIKILCLKILMNIVVVVKDVDRRGLKCHKTRWGKEAIVEMKELMGKDRDRIVQIIWDSLSNLPLLIK